MRLMKPLLTYLREGLSGKLKTLVLLTLPIVSCTHHGQVYESEDALYTIEVNTGSWIEDQSLYARDFKRLAEEKCGPEFEVVYRGREPWTLKNKAFDRHYFYQIVECLDYDGME